MDDKLIAWLSSELKRRSWSHRELARRAGLSQTAISSVLSGERKAGWDFCAAVAEAMGEMPERVLRLAGLLQPLQAGEGDVTLRELIEIARRLPREERLELL